MKPDGEMQKKAPVDAGADVVVDADKAEARADADGSKAAAPPDGKAEGTDGESIRDWSQVKRVIEDRDRFKGQLRDAEEAIKAYEAKERVGREELERIFARNGGATRPEASEAVDDGLGDDAYSRELRTLRSRIGEIEKSANAALSRSVKSEFERRMDVLSSKNPLFERPAIRGAIKALVATDPRGLDSVGEHAKEVASDLDAHVVQNRAEYFKGKAAVGTHVPPGQATGGAAPPGKQKPKSIDDAIDAARERFSKADMGV